MKSKIFILLFAVAALWACEDPLENSQGDLTNVENGIFSEARHGKMQRFKVRIENVIVPKQFFGSGSFGTAPAFPGDSYQFSFNAGPGHKLSFATMFVQSNDLFFGPGEGGIALYDANNDRVTGDVTSYIELWDTGTEVNEEPGVGPNQAPRQTGPNTGQDENGVVMIVNDGFSYPAVSDVIKVTLDADPNSSTGFILTIENISGSSSLPSPLAPGNYVVHGADAPLFTVGQVDRGFGLEALAEDGDNVALGDYLAKNTGLVGPFAPGAWAMHRGTTNAMFVNNTPDFGEGLEMLAEDGGPSELAASLSGKMGVGASGAFTTPVGGAGPAPLFPGESYEFEFDARSGSNLSFATMFVQSNDLFVAPGDRGIKLFIKGQPISGDITHYLDLWDAGTEVNEFPGAGLNQAPRQSGPNTGATENGNVMIVNDGYEYPAVSDIIRVYITPISSTSAVEGS